MAAESLSKIRPKVKNEYSRLTHVLVVSTPDVITSFTDLVVNPIQAEAAAGQPKVPIINHPGAAEKHRKFLDTLENGGVELVYSRSTPIKEGHTPLFTRDTGIIIDDKVIPSKFRFPYRDVEVQGLLDVVHPQSVVHSDREYMIEGGDVVVLGDDLVLVGIGPRTNKEGLALLRETFPQKEVIPVFPIVQEKAFHLDTTMGVLGEKLLVHLPDLVPQKLVGELKDRGYEFVEASQDEFQTCSTNVIAIDDRRVIAAEENQVTNQRMKDAGVDVIEVPLSGILSQGGGPHCLTLPLVRG